MFRVVAVVVVGMVVADEDARERDGVCFNETHCHEHGDAGAEGS